MQDRGRSLLWHGMALFLLGLLTGLIQNALKNPRMGLAAHLEGLMNGTFLLAVGAAWSKVRLSSRQSAVAYWAALAGTYGNWAVTLLAAILGTAAMTPMASAGFGAPPWREAVVTFGFVAVGILILVASGLLLFGFRRHGQPQMLRVWIALVLMAAPSALRAELIPPKVVFPLIPREGKTQADFVPAGWMVEKQAQADLNGDNRLDFMMVLHMTDPKNVVANPDGFGVDELDTNPRMLVVGFQDRQHRFHLQVANHTLIPRQTNPVLDDPLADAEVKNGALKISLGFWASAGSWYTSQVEYTLRFESECFRLIGYDYDETKRNTGETSAISVNYLTGKVKASTGTIEDDVMHDKWRPLKGKRRVCLEDIGDGLEFHPEA